MGRYLFNRVNGYDHPYPRFYYGFYSILSLKLRQKEIEAPCTKVQGIFYAR
jgi:hypothetical protein